MYFSALGRGVVLIRGLRQAVNVVRHFMRTLTIYSLFCLIFSVCGCTKEFSVSGEYEITSKTLNDRMFLHKMKSEGRIVGSKLNLESDSTFLYVTCGNQMTGYWRKMQDSISLYVVTNVYRSDSMMSIGQAIIPKEPITFQIRKRQLYRLCETTDLNRSDLKRFVELLTRKD